tara:strand:- start:153 stop:422 length:270 start_codon:yes stop_codon:yes gene_type:complete
MIEDISTHIITILIGILSAGLAGIFAKLWLSRTPPTVVSVKEPPKPDEAIAVARVEVDRQAEAEQEEVREVIASGDADALADMINKRKR